MNTLYLSDKDKYNDYRDYLNYNVFKTYNGYDLIKAILYFTDNKNDKQDVIELFISKYKAHLKKELDEEKHKILYPPQPSSTPIRSKVKYEKSFLEKLFSEYLFLVIIFIIIIMYNTCKN
jgi:hypothetical protein